MHALFLSIAPKIAFGSVETTPQVVYLKPSLRLISQKPLSGHLLLWILDRAEAVRETFMVLNIAASVGTHRLFCTQEITLLNVMFQASW